jgi:hypothetical protein
VHSTTLPQQEKYALRSFADRVDRRHWSVRVRDVDETEPTTGVGTGISAALEFPDLAACLESYAPMVPAVDEDLCLIGNRGNRRRTPRWNFLPRCSPQFLSVCHIKGGRTSSSARRLNDDHAVVNDG